MIPALPEMFSKLDGQRRLVAPLLPAPRMAPSIMAATSDAVQLISWEWIAIALRSTCQ
jgi:hypothetical protein